MNNKKYIETTVLYQIQSNEKNALEKFYSNAKNSLSKELENLLETFRKKYPADSKLSLNSQNEYDQDSTFYTGTGGNVYMYWRIFNMSNEKSHLELLQRSFNVNLDIISKLEQKTKRRDIPTSFILGPVGIWTMGCILASIKANQTTFDLFLTKILDLSKLCFSETEQEWLYGYSGYLYALVLITLKCPTELKKSNHNKRYLDVITKLFHLIVTEGIRQGKESKVDCMIYKFPNDGRKIDLRQIYLGAAHGVLGNIYVLLSTYKLFESEIFPNGSYTENVNEIKYVSKEDFNKAVQSSLESLMKVQFESGNFPASYADNDDELVHFCHGAVGGVFLFGLAYEIFKDKVYLDCASRAAECVYNRGLLLKGNGLCHGITGNSYALYYMYKKSKEEKWKTRSYQYALASVDPKIIQICRRYKDQFRKVKGFSDNPWSLMEGEAGTICLLSDILKEEIEFPAFELL